MTRTSPLIVDDVPEGRRRNLRAVRAKGGAPEMQVRRLLHGLGYRYRLHASDLPGRPDITFPGRRKAIEVRGCFWHQHPDPACRNANLPRTRADWWRNKLEANVARDARNVRAMADRGWSVLVLWECELADEPTVQERLVGFLGAPQRESAEQADRQTSQT